MAYFIFDIGGVLIDYSLERLIQRVSAQVGVGAEQAARVMASDVVPAVESGRIEPHLFFDAHIRPLIPSWSYADWVKAWMDNYSINDPGLSLFLELKGLGCPVYMLSNLAEYNKEALELKFPAFFRSSRGNFFSYELGCLKPEPEIYHKVCEHLGAAPEECVFVDDVQRNVDGAAAVGMQALLFSNAQAPAVRAALAAFAKPEAP